MLERLSGAAVPHAGRRHAALHAGAAQRHARSGRARRRADLPRQRRAHPGDVLRARLRSSPRSGPATSPPPPCWRRWRWRVGRARRDPAVPHGDHGRQRRAGGRAVAVRADRHHRQPADDEDRPRPATSGAPTGPISSRTRSWRSAATSCSAAGGCSRSVSRRRDRSDRPTTSTSTARTGSRIGGHRRVLLVGVLFLDANIGMAAFTGSGRARGAARRRPRAGDPPDAVDADPDGQRRERADGAAREDRRPRSVHRLLARLATPGTLTGVVAFVTGAHLGLQQHVRRRAAGLPADRARADRAAGGGDAFGVATSMNVGAHLVDMSPLSTTGAMCLAGDRRPDAGQADLQQAARLGPVDDRRRRDGLLSLSVACQVKGQRWQKAKARSTQRQGHKVETGRVLPHVLLRQRAERGLRDHGGQGHAATLIDPRHDFLAASVCRALRPSSPERSRQAKRSRRPINAMLSAAPTAADQNGDVARRRSEPSSVIHRP